MPADLQFFADFQGVIYGVGEKQTETKLYVNFVIQTFGVRMADLGADMMLSYYQRPLSLFGHQIVKTFLLTSKASLSIMLVLLLQSPVMQ